MKILGIIPARFGSTRFPGKPLALIQGKPMIQHVYRGASECTKLFDLLVATDDRKIYNAVLDFGGKAMMTDVAHVNGTSRCSEIAALYPQVDWVINIQGDEPLINRVLLDQVIDEIEKHPQSSILTMVRKMDQLSDALNPNLVKCVFNLTGQALYFSRSPIPYHRNPQEQIYYQHLGIYAFKKNILSALNALSPTTLERSESLEQLRWLEHGLNIQVGITDYIAHGVDLPEDIAKIEQMMNQKSL